MHTDVALSLSLSLSLSPFLCVCVCVCVCLCVSRSQPCTVLNDRDGVAEVEPGGPNESYNGIGGQRIPLIRRDNFWGISRSTVKYRTYPE